MRKFILLFLLVQMLAGSVAMADAANTLRTFKSGDRLPDFSLVKIGTREKVDFHPGKGKPAAVLFMSIEPEFRKNRSLALLSELDKINRDLRNTAEILAVYSDESGEATTAEYVKQNKISLPVLSDPMKDVYNEYGVFMMPLVVLIDADGALHEVIPYTYNIRELVEGNLKYLLKQWTRDDLQRALQPKDVAPKSKEEKEFIRRINYGRVMMNRRMFSQAIREFTVAAKMKSDVADAFLELGFAQLAIQNYPDAEASFRKALEISPDSDDAVGGLGLALYGKKDIAGATRELENALISPQPRLEVILALAEIYESNNNIDKAMRLNKLAVSRLMTMYEHRWSEGEAPPAGAEAPPPGK
ncbi:MAG: tetratricopeptide repeat protein [Thermodesulfobacteriota bacterium]